MSNGTNELTLTKVVARMRLICVDTISDAVTELKRIGVDDYSIDVMAPKALGRTIRHNLKQGEGTC